MGTEPVIVGSPAALARAVEVNEALLLGAVRQHELTEAAERLNEQLRGEILARERIAAELSEKARELADKARLLDLTHEAIIVRDMAGHIRYWNRGAENLYGWSFAEARGRVSHVLLKTECLMRAEQMLGELQRTNRWTGEQIHTTRAGARVNVFVAQTLDRDGAGNPVAVLENITDITGRKEAEEALRASEARFQVLFELGPIAIFSCDRGGVIQNYNRHAAKLWGRDPEIGEGGERNCGSLRRYDMGGRLLATDETPLLAVLETGISVKDVELLIERPDGSRIAVAVAIEPLKDAQDEITGAIVAFYDITERRALEDALVSRAGDLAQADRSKDEFLAMLAHELRNPLAPLRNAAEILRTPGVTGDEHANALRIIGRQIENMSQMIDDLLDISRITEGKIELRCAPVALEAVLTSATSLARSGLAARGQTLEVSMPADPVFLHADATRLEQIFNNLLGNACKYSGEGCHIVLRAERAEGGVRVSVRDDGAGIAPELLPHVFDLFVQASRTLDRAHGGLGIGLTLVQRLVKLHGGSVEARSEGLGRGAEFIIRLPILAAAPPLPPAAPLPPCEISRRILIVDDNSDSARSLGLLQSRRGHQTRLAFTGPEAVAAAAEFLPEVVLLDIGLPGMDGFEVARRLRAMPAVRGVFLIAMSGYGREEDLAEAKLAGFDEYLIKPIDLVVLRDWLHERV